MERNIELNSDNLTSRYWRKKIINRTQTLETKDKHVSLESITIKGEELHYFTKLTNTNLVAQYTVISAIYSFLLKKLLSEFDGFVVSHYKEQDKPLLLAFPTTLDITFKEYLQKVKEEILETLKYSDYNNEQIAEKTGFNDLSALSHYAISINSGKALACNGVLLAVEIRENQDLDIQVSYAEGFVNKAIAEYLASYFEGFIVDLEPNLGTNLTTYSVLLENEKQQLLVDFNATDAFYPKEKTIVDLFEEQVERTPNAVAVAFKDTTLTYQELNEKSNQLARYINDNHKVNKGDIVGAFLPKSDNGVITLLAIMKLGAVYLPIDTNYPQERIDYLVQDSALKLVISDRDTLAIAQIKNININSINFDAIFSDNMNVAITADDLAYVIYTSGSTGNPKGVAIAHGSNVNMSLDQIKTFEVTANDKVVWFASVAFDASISEIMMSLYSGASLCIPTEEVIKDKDQFVSFLKETSATVVTFPPSYLGLLSEDELAGLRCIITAGEPANASKALAVVEAGIDYYNAYGPTECAVCVSIYKVTQQDQNKAIIPIGTPIANTKIYILDEALQPVPIGVTGKLYVAGTGLAKAYLHKPELTAEKFITNPFQKGEKMYDTGDLGCWLADGNIEFLGRKDYQVKVRGYRIELGEIENTLLQYSQNVKQAVVEVKENNKEKVLVAYFVSKTNLEKAELRSFLQKQLPDYMIPAFYVALKELPLTPNGKIDRKALPEIASHDIIRREYVAPVNTTEECLVAIWQEVLGIEKIGTTDNFFELGGHSLKVTKMLYQINRTFEVELQIKNVLALQNIIELAKMIENEIVFVKGITTNRTIDLATNKNLEVWEI